MGVRMRALIGTMGMAALAGAALAGAARAEQPAAAPTETPAEAAAAVAAPGSCESFTRSSVGTPPLVHDWLVRSADDHVRVCARQRKPGCSPL